MNNAGGEAFGLSLAKSNDQVFVGAPYATPTGAVSVYTRAGNVELCQSIGPRTCSSQQFGASLAADRDTLWEPRAESSGSYMCFGDVERSVGTNAGINSMCRNRVSQLSRAD